MSLSSVLAAPAVAQDETTDDTIIVTGSRLPQANLIGSSPVNQVDAEENPLPTIEAMKFYEVQKYITKIRYVFLLEPLVISEQLFQRQSPEVQKILMRAGKEAQEHCRQFLILFEDSI